MSNSRDTLELLETLVEHLPKARAAHLYGDALTSADEAAQSLLPLLASLEQWLLSAALSHDSWEPEEQRSALEALRSARSRAAFIQGAQDREQLSRVRFLAGEIKPQLNNALAQGHRAWQRRIAQDVGSLPTLESLLSAFPDTSALGLRIHGVALAANALRNQFPPARAHLEQHAALRDQVAQLRRELADIGAGESVQRFLLALADGTATLDMLDDVTLQWIRQRRAESRIGLSLRRAGGQ